MVRLYERHRVRETEELDGIWRFSMVGTDKVYEMAVPGCWEQHPDFPGYRGKGIYSREIYSKRRGNIRLVFKGVSHTADVYFDGVKVIHHYNAYTPFSTVVKNVTAGVHQIRVEVDNTFGEHSALHIPNDYYTYGGITRPVSMETVSDVYIEHVHFTPSISAGVWNARIEASVVNLSAERQTVEVRCTLAGYVMSERAEIHGGGRAFVVFEREFDCVKPWSPKNPELYLLETVVCLNGVALDDLIERIGFRTVEIRGSEVYLNHERVYFLGFNRHEDYGGVGCAIPLQLMTHDMDLLQDMGANAVRTCHYPNDERFLDLCDERGILVWEENHARGLTLENMQNPNFEQQCGDCIREMIENHYNHPAIVIWGILNECASETKEGRRMYQKQYEQIRSMDGTRPVTSATCRHFTDICLDLPDIVSFNMYSGWYQDCSIEERNQQELEWIRQSGGDGKPVIVSEVGAGAIYGYRDRSRCKWSEERQADLIRDSLDVYMNDKNITGIFIWQFADCRVTEEGGWFASRAKCHNNKGILDEYRRPKMAYDAVKEMFETARDRLV